MEKLSLWRVFDFFSQALKIQIAINSLMGNSNWSLSWMLIIKGIGGDKNSEILPKSKSRSGFLTFFFSSDLLGQIALSITFQFWPVFIDTKVIDDVFLIDREIHFNH